MGGTPRGECADGTARPERKRASQPGVAQAEFPRRAGSGSSAPGRCPHAPWVLAARRPAGLAAPRLLPRPRGRFIPSLRFASKFGSAELDPVMIKPMVKADSQWNVPARTHPSAPWCALESGDSGLTGTRV